MASDSYEYNENPYRSPESSGRSNPLRFGQLVASGWLYRKVQLLEPFNVVIEYNGRGIGCERVLVNSVVVAKRASWLWFAPRFEFVLSTKLGELPAIVEVRVWPWFALYRITIRVGGIEVYVEDFR